MRTLSLLLVFALGASVVSSLSLIPQQCFLPPCARPPPDWVYPWCEHQCTVNSDCGRRGLCCPGCGCRVCQLGAPIDSCKNRICPDGQVCVNRPVVCKRAPCPQTQCVPISTKPGNCPQYRCLVPQFPTCSHKCNTDKDCKGNLKCCTDCTGCRTCLAPWGITNNGCSNMQCPGGETCVALPQPRCECISDIVNCFEDPCRFASCEIEGAECRANYCGGCHAVWYKNGQIVTNCYGGVTA